MKKKVITKLKEYRFSDPVFRTCFQIFDGMEQGRFDKIAGEDPNSDRYVTGGKALTVFKDGACLVWLCPTIAGNEKKLAILHELIHITNKRLKDRGIDNTSGAGEEAIAYLYEYYADMLMKVALL